MINVPAQGIARPQSVSVPSVRISPRLFWGLFALLGIGIAAIVFTMITALPERVPLAKSADVATVREAVWARLNGTTRDPLIELQPGLTARESNIRGLALGGRTYYYYVEGQPRFDPAARGVLGPNDIETVLRDDHGPQTIVIYTGITPQ